MRNTILSVFAFICILTACKKDPEPSKVVISDTKIWTTVSPSIDMENVSVFSDIKLIGLHAINWPIHNVVDKNTKGYYKIQLDEVKVYTEAGNLEGDVSISSDTVVFKPKKCLPANTKIYVQAKAHYETKDEGEKEFSVYMVDGKPAEETYEYSFTTVNFDPSDIIDNIMPSMTHPEINLNDSITVDLKYKNNQKIYFEWNKPDSILLNIDKIEISSNGLKVETINSYSKDSDRIVIKPIKSWIPGSDVTLKIYNSWTVQNNKAKIVLKDSIKPITYSYSTVSSNTIDSLKQEYIEYEYPVNGQCYLLKNECSEGYMKFRFDIPNIVNVEKYSYSASFISADSTFFVNIPIFYNKPKLQFEYTLPIEFLKNSCIYKIDFLRKNNSNSHIDTIYTTYFRTSQYNSFIEKVNSFSYKGSGERLSINGEEDYDYAELNARPYYYQNRSFDLYRYGLVQFELEPNSAVNSLVNTIYSDRSIVSKYRNTDIVGIPPYQAIYFRLYYSFLSRTTKYNFNRNFFHGLDGLYNLTGINVFNEIIESDLRAMSISDWENTRDKISKKMFHEQKCNLIVKYVLPGGKVSSEAKIQAKSAE